jgi:serine/threonine-protein kinase
VIPGDLIADRYRLLDQIAEGGMGNVWRADDEVLGRTVAVKAMRAEVRDDPTFSARFRLEARSIAALHHPGVVSVYDYGEVDGDGPGYAYLVMAYVDGESLGARVARDGRLPAAVTMDLVGQVARALEAVHEAGIIHRDVKPDNVLIDADGRAVLVDFGVVRSATASELTGSGQVIGTARYMAPEQVSKLPLTPATDVYALGAVAYHCLAGVPPFGGDNPIRVALSQVRDEAPPLPTDVPDEVRDVVATAMEKDPTDRYASAAAMADAAEAALRAITFSSAPPVRALPVQRAVVSPVLPQRSAEQTLTMPAVGRHPSRTAAYVLAFIAAVAVAGIIVALALNGRVDPTSNSQLTNPRSSPSTHASTGTGSGKSEKPRPHSSASTAGTPTTEPSSTPTGTTSPEPTASNSPDPGSGNGGGTGSGGSAGTGGGTGSGGGSGGGTDGSPSPDPSS